MRAHAAHASSGPHRALTERLQTFFADRIWAVRLTDLRRGKAMLYRAGRVGYSTVQGFRASRLTVRAAALTYYSVLSIVPFLAFTFSVLKGLGAYNAFVTGTVRPWVQQTFGANPVLLRSVDGILSFVDRTNVSTLGAVGLLVLVYTSVSLLGSVEDTLNEIWGAKTKRSFLRQVTDYVTLLVTTPLLVVAATTAATAAQSSAFVLFLREELRLGPVIDFLLHSASLAVVGIAFFAVYTILPNAKVRPVSAAIGAAVAAILWQGALVLYVRFQMGVSSYNALYSALSAVPVFLVWTYVSWVVVLLGAQVAASHQNEWLVRQRFRAERADQALKETLAVLVAAEVARDFETRGPWRGWDALSERLGVSPLTIEETLDALVRAGILAPTSTGELGYVPARDPGAIRLTDVRDALRRDARAENLRGHLEPNIHPALRRVLDGAEEERQRSRYNLTLRELSATMADGPPAHPAAPPPPGPKPEPPDAPPVMDAK